MKYTCLSEMDQKWISVFFLLSAIYGLSAYVPHRYHFVNESKTWTEAQSYCRQTYTDLATINNMEEMKKLNDTVQDKSVRVWIGLEKVTWQWSLQDATVYRERQSYSNWTAGEPNSNAKKEMCVQLNGDGSWNDDDCSRLFPFVCFEGEISSYVIISGMKNWHDAQSYCREHYTDLASVRNQTENDEIKKVADGKTVWIGLFRVYWKWSDQSYSSFRYWKQTQPYISSGKENCAHIVMTDGGYWNYANCETKFPFICSERKNSTYMLIKEAKTWREAQSYCREHYTDLVSVRNQTENQQILDLTKNPVSNDVWIGLFYDSWKWADQSASLFRYWASTQPDNNGGNQNCTAVFMAEQGQWHDLNGNSQLPFICHQNKLILIKQNLTWREALRYCRDHHVDLVSVHSEEIQLWVKEVAQKASTEHVWLGLRHTCTLSFWYWVSGESICYQNWAPGNGTGEEDCSSVERTGAVQSRGGQQWVSLPEDQELNFICTTYEDEI
ncbi:macrophage mannose receptor 1-like isoform X2 [Colossoma macropomum]|uniref:macrophage mannose receptor 1-like isoform X2 n=1 Tax=Colossoma macropomum TaxID=42526 RepID=UPI00186444D8|nr:macrophage mannose receptor 1-like isoform X2 [Colossoma macropomum]